MQRSKLILDGLNCPPHLFTFKMEVYWIVESELNLFTIKSNQIRFVTVKPKLSDQLLPLYVTHGKFIVKRANLQARKNYSMSSQQLVLA